MASLLRVLIVKNSVARAVDIMKARAGRIYILIICEEDSDESFERPVDLY